MNAEEFVRLQSWLYTFASLVVDVDLDGFVESCDRADTIAPFVDPTLYIAKARDLRRVRDLAASLREFKKQAELTKEEVRG